MDKAPFTADKLREDITFNTKLCGFDLNFTTTWGLFSPRGIDDGSELLLNYIKPDKEANILDLGCGYGPLGIALAKQAPMGETLMVDKDFVAVDYANKNVKQNHLDNCAAMLSNGFAQIPHQRFDIIVSNLPAKVGNEMLYLYLFDALNYLKPDGQLYVVTINGLRQFIKKSFKQVFGNYKKLKQSTAYTVAMCQRQD